MDSPLGEFLIRWSVRIAIGGYLLRLWLESTGGRNSDRERWIRWIWTGGCVLYLIHVVCAFHFFHHWSHAHAYEYTARQTAQVTGMEWGGGLYVNYGFTLLWIIDVAIGWIRPNSYLSRSATITRTVQSVFAFVIFNATVVFGPPFWTWAGGAFLAALVVGTLRRRIRSTPRRHPERSNH